eukprot:1156063-Pelagomonas_calceolata.AAC.12
MPTAALACPSCTETMRPALRNWRLCCGWSTTWRMTLLCSAICTTCRTGCQNVRCTLSCGWSTQWRMMLLCSAVRTDTKTRMPVDVSPTKETDRLLFHQSAHTLFCNKELSEQEDPALSKCTSAETNENDREATEPRHAKAELTSDEAVTVKSPKLS